METKTGFKAGDISSHSELESCEIWTQTLMLALAGNSTHCDYIYIWNVNSD